jgi:putative endonuclease
MPWTYVLKSLRYNKTYVGSTTDLERRLAEHNSGKGTFSRRYAPWKIMYEEECPNLPEARKREKYLKSSAGRRFLKTKYIPG